MQRRKSSIRASGARSSAASGRSSREAGVEHAALYRMIWRWHFYAGLLVMPLILVLSVTGSIYLFKPQIDRWEERAWQGLSEKGAVSPAKQVQAALDAWPSARFDAYRLPEREGDAAVVTVAPADGNAARDVFVSPRGKVLGSRDPEKRISALVATFHGSLMLGRIGDWIVELAASWAIVTILTGLYLWWPNDRRLAGVLWPRLSRGGRVFWRDLHAVAGFWVSGLALLMLATGLPWAGVWGSAFASVRAELGLVKGVQEWKIGSGGGEHTAHHRDAMAGMAMPASKEARFDPAMFNLVVAEAKGEHLAFPASVLPPGAPQRFGPPTGNVWTAKSEAQDRPLQRSVTYGLASGRELAREGFAGKHPIDRIVNYGIAWHEGQLLGWFNQLVGVLLAVMLITLTVSGFVMWRKRRPAGGGLGALRAPARRVSSKGLVGGGVVLAALLPLFALSFVALWLAERLLLRRIGPVAEWLGLTVEA
ncbi:MAG: PepSY domain-containing protein [Novosphingobium sp.]|nr:PepSY domain-containing protein [Novosphingobium sp.]